MENKKCSITLSSFIKDDTVSENNETRALGLVEISGRGCRISFSEEQEGEKIDTRILITDSLVSLSKRGGITSDMRFIKNVLTKSEYVVSGYKFDCDIHTDNIEFTKTDSGVLLKLFYGLKIGGAVRESELTLKAVYL